MVLETQQNQKISIVVLLLGCSFGTILEFYSFALIAYFHNQVVNAFFPSTSDTNIKLLQSFTLVGVAFVGRPFGGLYFGYYGDKHGRVNALRLSILLMSLPTFLIGCTPNFAMIGYWSTVIVFILRFIQGFASGGEISSAMVYVVEEAPANRKGLYMIAMWLLGSGDILALFAYKLFSSGIMARRSFYLWGFRIPFLLSLLIAAAAIYARYLLPSTPEFQRMRDNGMILANPLKYALKHNLREIGVASIALTTPTLLYYVSSQWVVAYLYDVKEDQYAYDIALLNFFCYVPMGLFVAWLCDKYGAYSMCVYFGALSFILILVSFTWMGFASNPITLSVLQVLASLGAVCCFVPLCIWTVLYLSDPRTRNTIFGFAYNIGMVVLVSVSFDICTALQSADDRLGGTYVAVFIGTMVLLALVAAYFGNKYPFRCNSDIVATSDNDKLIDNDRERLNL